jgi:predicted RNA-binding protein YlqC (UPF0109 family)
MSVALVNHAVKAIVAHPDEVVVTPVEGDAVTILELRVHPDDIAVVDGERGRTVRALRSVVSAASGERKTTVELIGGGPVQE